ANTKGAGQTWRIRIDRHNTRHKTRCLVLFRRELPSSTRLNTTTARAAPTKAFTSISFVPRPHPRAGADRGHAVLGQRTTSTAVRRPGSRLLQRTDQRLWPTSVDALEACSDVPFDGLVFCPATKPPKVFQSSAFARRARGRSRSTSLHSAGASVSERGARDQTGKKRWKP